MLKKLGYIGLKGVEKNIVCYITFHEKSIGLGSIFAGETR
jgi:hypothetical protein